MDKAEVHPNAAIRTMVVIGVAGAGKTTLGRALAHAFAADFLDADDFHSLANVEKMRQGHALTDSDRAPWLETLNTVLRERVATGLSTVLACSALRAAYREQIANGLSAVDWIFLEGDFSLIAERIRGRADHYMPESLLRSQFEALERPENAISVATSLTTEEQVAAVRESVFTAG
jgi:carbohydrate kinase (thermoresistant glucokinase family)